MPPSRRIVVFDVDGVLIDSYSCLPSIYADIGKKFFSLTGEAMTLFTTAMIIGEDFNDYHQRYPPSTWWPSYFQTLHLETDRETIRTISDYYWHERMKRSLIIKDVPSVLEELLHRGYIIAIACGTDGIPGLKQKRIQHHGLDQYFSDILIAAENCNTKLDCLRLLLQKYGISPNQLTFVDDKPRFLKEARSIGIKTCQVLFEGPLKLSWIAEPSCHQVILHSLKEILAWT